MVVDCEVLLHSVVLSAETTSAEVRGGNCATNLLMFSTYALYLSMAPGFPISRRGIRALRRYESPVGVGIALVSTKQARMDVL